MSKFYCPDIALSHFLTRFVCLKRPYTNNRKMQFCFHNQILPQISFFLHLFNYLQLFNKIDIPLARSLVSYISKIITLFVSSFIILVLTSFAPKSIKNLSYLSLLSVITFFGSDTFFPAYSITDKGLLRETKTKIKTYTNLLK